MDVLLEGRRCLPLADMDCMGVIGSIEEAENYDSSLSEPHSFVFPPSELPLTLQVILDAGSFRTLFISEPKSHFSSGMQRAVFFDLALYRGVQVVEKGIHVTAAVGNPHDDRILREGTELCVALRAHSNATITDETRSRSHARKVATDRHARGNSLREIATHLNKEAIPTLSGTGRWSPSAVKKLLDSGPETHQ
ncbi:recombinase family protein [Streptomyces sp. NPDC093252]|uniref:recombinase family protein n=1 Tax=Streptomyces sp. NPDC093252 TaxID=3154980 RepID=UPI00342F40F0